jgi:hypothetical protein
MRPGWPPVERRDNMMLQKKYILTFDDAFAVLELEGKWAHAYEADDMEQAARDLLEYILEGLSDDWDGNEPELIGHGKRVAGHPNYRVYTNLEDLLVQKDEEIGWANVREFVDAWLAQ